MLHRRTHLHATPDPVVCPAQHQPRPVFGPEHDRPLTSIYTRADAVADGLLIEVPRQLAEEYRIPAPRSVAVTAQLWCAAVATATYPQPLAPYVWPQVYPYEVRERLAHLLWHARSSYEADPARSHRQTFVLWHTPAARADATTPAHVAPGSPNVDPIRVRLTLTEGDHGETVATLAHAPADEVGRFHLDTGPDTAWPAVSYGPDSTTGDARPLVTIETLSAILDHANADVTRPPEIEAWWSSDGRVTIGQGGRDVTLTPYPDAAVFGPGVYPLGPLGWPLRRVGR